jgi:uncharacterized membrane protein YbaN (DUF454 family)
MKRFSPRRWLWIGLGTTCVALGTIGMFLPLLPTAIFMIIAAYAFARSSPALHDWIMAHKVFGPMINNWNEHGAIPTKAKILTIISILASFGLAFLFHLPVWAITVQGICLLLVAVFVVTRPKPPSL